MTYQHSNLESLPVSLALVEHAILSAVDKLWPIQERQVENVLRGGRFLKYLVEGVH